MSSDPFELLRSLGLREHHRVLDIGCGTLGLGSLLIPYLRPRHYFGVEPQQNLIEDGVRFHVGHDMFDRKEPQFITDADFSFHKFAVKFDFMIAHGLFPHIGSGLIGACLRNAAGSLDRDGLLLASWKPGATDYEGEGWNPYIEAEYTPGKLQSLAGDAGLGFKVLDQVHPEGHFWTALFLSDSRKVLNDVAPVKQSLPVVVEGHAGYVERIQDIGGYVLVEGWAIDPESGRPAARVLIADGAGDVRATIPIHLSRPDAVAVLGEKALMCGFRAMILSERLGDLAGLSYFAAGAGGGVYPLTSK